MQFSLPLQPEVVESRREERAAVHLQENAGVSTVAIPALYLSLTLTHEYQALFNVDIDGTKLELKCITKGRAEELVSIIKSG